MSARSNRIRTTLAVRRRVSSRTRQLAEQSASVSRSVPFVGATTPVPAAANPMRDWKLGDYLQRWLQTKRGTLKPTSYDTLERVVISYIQPNPISEIPLSCLTSDDIQLLLGKLKEEDHYSYSTVKKVHDCLNASLRYAIQRKVITENPMDLVIMPSRALFQASEITYYSPAECKLILEESTRTFSTGVSVHWYGPVYTLLLLTGLRVGELLGLHCDDYDPERAVLKVRRSVCKVRNRDEQGNLLPGFTLQEVSTKSFSGTREIPLPPQAVEAIEKLLSMAGSFGSVNLVVNSKGNMPSPEQIGRSFHNLLRNVGLESAGVHKLRHTYASLLFAAKTDLKTISRLLGHASANITLSTYIHIADQIPHSAVEPLGVLVDPKSA